MQTVLRLLISIILTSCAYGPTQEKKSSLNYFNGEHYEQSAIIFGVPVLERKTKETVISGKIQMDDPFAKLPADVELSLISDDKKILTTHAHNFGSFEFQGIISNGAYSLKAIASHLSGEILININSYKITDVIIVMHSIP
jgi:hypothetical protein